MDDLQVKIDRRMYIVSTLESFDRQEKPATFLCPVFVCGVLVFEFESSDATPLSSKSPGSLAHFTTVSTGFVFMISQSSKSIQATQFMRTRTIHILSPSHLVSSQFLPPASE